ncbi:MAG: hypothetical protein A3F84_04690 [Candidatus Handelsmanbacteria bacterium RIFCSPLOWO2_12_FULL_64_10]|uniref:4Fe-4S ferredoxin-type domain-containing protein n=1 Tax=Handelsmanbacteria sp. (strain RIFCSPLOWO2_12_FULL_64_10) TaxID=1817868 RepID=A0A1F6CQ89_HANXR|nr:MAG: hypothetical protein A3F84_04690 [Candidatus Handelsmanbacteria bacterium RIFCSPLOWO2_12_FULL_64_10]
MFDWLIGEDSIFDMGDRYPVLSRHFESNIEGLFVVGNLAGSPDIKAALNAGHDVAHHIAGLPPAGEGCDHDVVIVGGGPAGLNAALEFKKLGLRYLVLEKKGILSTIRAFEGDLILYYAVTGDREVRGDLPYRETTAGALLSGWGELLKARGLNLREREGVLGVQKVGGAFEVRTDRGVVTAGRVVVATGKLMAMKRLDIAEVEAPEGGIKARIDRTEMPHEFMRRCGIRLENTWNWRRYVALALTFAAVGAFYLIKKLTPDWVTMPASMPVVGGRNLAGLYPILYTVVVIAFGTQALFRWRRVNPFDRIQPRKYLMLMSFQAVFFCLLPEFVLHNWKAYGLVYAWPLTLSPVTVPDFVHDWSRVSTPDGPTLDPYHFYFYWTLFLSFVLIPAAAIFTGKQYCSWVCGCGGLAETLGDRWRHYSPKGPENIRRERYLFWITGATAAMTLLVGLGYDVRVHLGGGINAEAVNYGGVLMGVYSWAMDTFMIAIIPVSLYPFLGGKVWCRYWCPTAGFMHLVSKWFTERKVGRYRIESRKERCIACNLCSRYCEVGIDVRRFALRGEAFDNVNSSCIGCGVCITVCPTETLNFGAGPLMQIEGVEPLIPRPPLPLRGEGGNHPNGV